MLMRPRHSLVELFSTLIQFDGDQFQRWVVDQHLKRNMEGRVTMEGAGGGTENFWALYWHKQWENSSPRLAKNHLVAYLQEPCYWIARKAATHFTSTQYSLADCFQLAIIQVDKVLQGFDSQQGFNLKSYASAAFNSIIRDHLRQRGEVDICTDWSLLRKVSQKRLGQALEQQGLTPAVVDAYRLAWVCFKTCYVPQQKSSTRRLNKPGQEVWAAITELYNTERKTQLPNGGELASPKQVETWLSTCARAVRSYLYPSSVSINAPKPGQESTEFIDQLTGEDQLLPLSSLISQEEQDLRQQQQQDLAAVIKAALGSLDPTARELLRLYYSGTATQQQIAAQLNLKQYAISRQLSRIRKELLKRLSQWSQETLHITPSSDVLKYTSAVLEEWLANYYANDSHPAAEN